MYKTFEYRLYPNHEQRRLLFTCLVESRHLYNEMLETVKAHYDETGKFPSKYDLCSLFKGRGGEYMPGSTVQALADRLTKALRQFVPRKKAEEKAGFPRFKGATRWHSIRLTGYGVNRDVVLDPKTGKLRMPKKIGGRVKIKQHRPLEGIPKTANLVLRANGHWYVLIVCDLGEAPEKRDGASVGLDVGLTHFVADSDGNTVENPRYFKNAQKKLRRAQRKASRRKKGSNRKRKAAKQTACQHLKIARQRKDHAHKVARSYVDAYAFIAVEDLRVCNMLKNHHLAKAIADASWSAFKNILALKAEEAGVRVIEVPPHFTSQRCFNCGEDVQKSLSIRTHVCPHCGHTEDRDVNAAKNILAKARTGPSGDNVAGCGERSPRSCLF